MLRQLLLHSILFVFAINTASAQAKCGSDILHNVRMNSNEEYKNYREMSENLINSVSLGAKSASILKIPVVVHIVYFEDSLHQNISDQQIYSQLDVLNKDFNKLNWDTMKTPQVWKNLIADCEIEFVLANRDPSGQITSGITRRSTDINEIGDINSDLIYSSTKGGQDIWNRDSYLNVWVCAIKGGVYGFSGYPGSPAKSDGIVIDYNSFGSIGTAKSPTHLGRTLTHEIGHWFNLFHLWGTSECGNDLVNDTPIQEKANYDCPFFPSKSLVCPNGPNGDMFNNYMDYADDNCMNMFTHGQKDRMISSLNNLRSSLFNSKGYNSTNESVTAIFRVYPVPASDYITIELDREQMVNGLEIINLQGLLVKDYSVDEKIKKYTINVDDLDHGIYFLKLHTKTGVIVNRMSVWR